MSDLDLAIRAFFALVGLAAIAGIAVTVEEIINRLK